MLTSILAATCLLGSTMALSLTPSGAMRMNAMNGRASMVRMDDIPMTKPTDANVVESDREPFGCSFEIPKKGISEYGTCNMNFKPLLATNSELVMVRYELPFGLSAEPKGRVVVVTKDGKEGGEKVGDILRFSLEWKGASPGMFDVCKCMERQLVNSFDQVVQALVSNDGTYADEIVLIFERPLE